MLGLLDDQRTTVPGGIALSAMQHELLRHLADGLTQTQSARRFGIRPYGVSNRLVTLYAALGAGNAARAVARAHELGLLARTPRTLPPLDRGERGLPVVLARMVREAAVQAWVRASPITGQVPKDSVILYETLQACRTFADLCPAWRIFSGRHIEDEEAGDA